LGRRPSVLLSTFLLFFLLIPHTMESLPSLLADLSSDSESALQGICNLVAAAVQSSAPSAEVKQTLTDVFDALLGTSTTSLIAFACGTGPPKARAGALNVVGNLCLLARVVARNYALNLRRSVISLIRSDQSAEVAVAALCLLDRVVVLGAESEVLKPADLYSELLAAKQRTGSQFCKKGSRPRGSIFRSIGLLLYEHSSCFDEKVRGG
jgi:hypothetical protein